ncbi:embigin [Simochromis diagramma]|uniref:embigin n=1 Tax=Simochromis diagramma TaxID=43689 RepID=UPI001A7F0506|nr:embigin [Simochromis diagramma]
MSASWKQPLFQICLLCVCCRHINTNTLGSTKAPQVPTTALKTTVKSVVLKGENHTEEIQLHEPVNLTLACTWTGNQKKLPNISVYWTKDGKTIQDSERSVQLENEQYTLKQDFHIVSEQDLGSYSCVFGTEAQIDFILAAPQISEVRDKPIVSYLGDFVVIYCKMEETKPEPRTWTWYKVNGTEKILVVEEPQRYEIHNEGWKTKLKISNLTDEDSGSYYCGAVYRIGTSVSHVELKIISFIEPLKPFLTILAEVIVLVTAILLYEKIHSRKNNTEEENLPNGNQKNELPQEEAKELEGNTSMRQRKV